MTRPPVERMQKILDIIAEGGFPNSKTIAQTLEVAHKTVQRDIAFLRNRFGKPIEYDRSKYGYFFNGPVGNSLILHMSDGELIALFIAQKALRQHEGTPFEQPLKAAMEKLIKELEGSISISWSDLETAISFRGIEANPVDLAIFQQVNSAVQNHVEIHFDYKKLGATDFEQRRLHPYHLACINNQWYLFGYDQVREAIRKFVLSRMRNLQRTSIRFKKPIDFDVNQYLSGSFGVFSAEGQFSVRIWFDSFAGQLVRERMWHRTQKLQDLPNGELELTMQLTSLREIESWILSWGAHAKALEPPDLVRVVEEEVEKMRKYYV